jgi:hypothetical protein
MDFGSWWTGGVLLAAGCVTGLLASACGTLTRTVGMPPEIEGAEFVGNTAVSRVTRNIPGIMRGARMARIIGKRICAGHR